MLKVARYHQKFIYIHRRLASHTNICCLKCIVKPGLLTLFAVKCGLPHLSEEPLTNRLLLSNFHSTEGNDSVVQKVNSWR